MRSATGALLWEMWQRHRGTVLLVAALTVAGHIVPPPYTVLLGLLAFLLLFGVFNYTEADGPQGFGSFPRRLFTLPVTTRRLVTVPVVAGIVAVELLYLAWMAPMGMTGSTSGWFVGVLLAALMVFYLAVVWTLDRLRILRVVILGGVVVAVFGVGLLPSFPPTPAPAWRSEPVLAAATSCAGLVAFLIALHHVQGVRCGRRRGSRRTLLTLPAMTLSRKQMPFASAAAAQFWFEWRTAGLVLPLVIAVLLGVVAAPLAWVARNNADDAMQLLLATLAAPVVLAVPLGMAFGRPAYWTEDLSVPAFVAVRPLSSDALVAIRMRVAAVSVACAWALVLAFVTAWMSLGGNHDALRQLALQWRAFQEQSIVSVYLVAALFLGAGILLSWRFLVIRLWSGFSGQRWVHAASIVLPAVIVVAGIALDAQRWLGWVVDDPGHMAIAVRGVAIVVTLKYWFAVFTCTRVSSWYGGWCLVAWLAGTVVLVLLAWMVWDVVRIYAPLDIERAQALALLLALLVMPLGRMGLAPGMLARNRHRA